MLNALSAMAWESEQQRILTSTQNDSSVDTKDSGAMLLNF
jgi:hypothetical protein